MESDSSKNGGNATAAGAEAERAEKLLREMTGVCGKRARIDVDDDRPRKFRRLEGGVRVAVDVVAPDAALVDDPVVVVAEAPDLGDADVRPMSPRLITVAAYTGTGSVFDWAAMHELLVDDELVEEPEAGDPLIVFVPGAASEVTISKHMLLCEIAKKLNLMLHEWKIVIEPTGVYRAYIEMDVPSDGIVGLVRRERFYGDDASTHNDALESAAGEAVDYLRFQCNVILKDANYDKVMSLEKRCACAEDFNGLFLDLINTKEKKMEALYAGFAGIVSAARRVCKDSMGVLPIRFADLDGPSGSSKSSGVSYVGLRPPVDPLDKLALAFVGVIEGAFKLLHKRPK